MGRAASRCKSAAEIHEDTTDGTVSAAPIKPSPVCKLETVSESPTPDTIQAALYDYGDKSKEETLNASSNLFRRQGDAKLLSSRLASQVTPGQDFTCCCTPNNLLDTGQWYGGTMEEQRQGHCQVQLPYACCTELPPSPPASNTDSNPDSRSRVAASKSSSTDGITKLKGRRSAIKLNSLLRVVGQEGRGDDNCLAIAHEPSRLSATNLQVASSNTMEQVHQVPKANANFHHEEHQTKSSVKPNQLSNRCEQLETFNNPKVLQQQQQQLQQVNGQSDVSRLGAGGRTGAELISPNCTCSAGGSSLLCSYCCCQSNDNWLDYELSPAKTEACTEMATRANIYNHQQVKQKQKQRHKQRRKQINQIGRQNRLEDMGDDDLVGIACRNNLNQLIDCERYLSSVEGKQFARAHKACANPNSSNSQQEQQQQQQQKQRTENCQEDKEDQQLKQIQFEQQQGSAASCDVQNGGFPSMNQASNEFIDTTNNHHHSNEKIGNKNNNDNGNIDTKLTFGAPYGCKDLAGVREKKLEIEQQQQGTKHIDIKQREIDNNKHYKSDLGSGGNKIDSSGSKSHMDWQNIAKRYGRMPHQAYRGPPIWCKIQQSCFCHVILSTLNFLFPFFTSFKNYSLPADLITDVVTGFTVAILHIPQGMAYGLLAGVEPIHGLYVSLVPVIIMAFMSKSPHMSYGTFAVVSILLANCTESIKQAMRQEHFVPTLTAPILNLTSTQTTELSATETRPPISSQLKQQQQQQNLNDNTNQLNLGDAPVVITNNHKQSDPGQQLLKNFLRPQQRASPEIVGAHSGYEDQSIWFSGPAATGGATAGPEVGAADLAHIATLLPSNIEILTCLCLIAGLIQLAMAIMRLGVLSLVFSDQLVSSFTTASAVHVATSQLGNLFDLTIPRVSPHGPFKVCRIWAAFVTKFLDGFNHYTALLSLMSLLFLLAIKELIEPKLKRRFKLPTCIPSELILMLALIVCSRYWRFNSDFGILVVGHVPTDLPVARVPRLDLVPWVVQDALTVAIVTVAMNLSLARVCAKKFKYRLNSNQELFALGTSNLISSFFSCFPCASSLSRTAVQSNLNARSQISSLISCAIVVSIICYFAPFFHDLPLSTLSCIIMIALKGILFQARELYDNWRLSKLDALVWLATFIFVIAFDVTYGLVLGILTSLSMVFYRLVTPNYSILGQLPDTEIYVAKGAFVECNEIDHVKIFRFNSALCYLNREMFKVSIERLLEPKNCAQQRQQNDVGLEFWAAQEKSLENGDKIEYLIIDCSALAFCDYSGVSALIEIIDELDERSIKVYLASCSLKLIRMIEKLKRTNLLERNVYPSITDAVNQARYLNNCNLRPSSASHLNDSTGGHLCLKSVISDTP